LYKWINGISNKENEEVLLTVYGFCDKQGFLLEPALLTYV